MNKYQAENIIGKSAIDFFFPSRKNIKVLGVFGAVVDINPYNHGFDGFGTFFETKLNSKKNIDFYKKNFEK